MKRIFLCTLLSICIGQLSLHAQTPSPYQDVIKLRALVQQNGKWQESDKSEIASILAHYCDENSVPTVFFNSNPFIKEFMGFSDYSGINYDNKNMDKSFNFLTSVGGLNITNAVDGLARFLVERTKQELSIAFFDRFKVEITASKELRTLFPQTARTLLAIDKEIYQFNTYLNTLRQVFAKDMANLYPNIKAFTRLADYQKLLDKYPEIKSGLDNAFYFVDAFSAGKHPGDILAAYDVNTIYLGDNQKVLTHNLRSGIQLLKVLSASFHSLSTDQYWVPSESVSLFFTDRIQRELYFAILYQQCKTITFKQLDGSGTTSVSDVLGVIKNTTATYETNITKYLSFIQNFAAHVNEVDSYMSQLKEKQRTKDTINFTDYYNLYQSTAVFFQDAFGVAVLPTLKEVLQDSMVNNIKLYGEKLVNVLTKTSDLFVDIRTKQYASAIINAVDLLHELDAAGLNQQVTTKLLKYGSFIANVSSAKNSEEVQAAIEAIAAPVGSSRVKRLSQFNVSLNAFTGLAFGKEWINGLVNREVVNTSSVTAPVGIAFSWGDLRGPFTLHNKEAKNDPAFRGHSFSAFISLIDIGAVTALRFGDSAQTASKLPEITLQNIIAPGMFVSWGIKKMPISLSGGYQYGPLFRDLNVANPLGNNFYQRFILSVNVDIPLLNLHTKTK